MAKKQLVICDLDGADGAEPFKLSVNEKVVAVDLCPKCATGLTKAVEQYFNAGVVKEKTNGGNGSDISSVRSWLQANGHKVADKGRISGELQKLYDEAHAE